MNPVFRSDAAVQSVEAAYREVLARWPVANVQTIAPTSVGPTFVISCGPEDAPPLILLHGAQANASAWMFDAPTLAKSFRMHVIDMIGEPGLSAPVRLPLKGDGHARWLDETLDGLGVGRAAVAGVSLGGWLAMDYAIRRPERVERLALVCPGGIGRQKPFLLKALPLMALGPWGRAKVRQMVFGPPPKTVPEPLRPFVALMGLIARSVRPRTEWLPVFGDEQLRALACPVLAIVGGKDVLLDSQDTRRRLEALTPRAEVVFLPQARHAIFGQTATLNTFLTRAF
jgi:pimeloyl-ACP methyl ester carboxylesterase